MVHVPHHFELHRKFFFRSGKNENQILHGCCPHEPRFCHNQAVQQRACQKRVTRLVPVIGQSLAVRVYQHQRDILHLLDTAEVIKINFFQRIETRRYTFGIRRVELDNLMPQAFSVPRRQSPVLSFDVKDDAGMFPSQKARQNKPHAFTASGRGKRQNMFGSVMLEVQ